MLDIEEDSLNGEEVIKHIIKMNVELFWFGGIGTYMKSETQTHIEVGDRANDAVRVDITDIQAKVIGEGANLGITQLGRIELDKEGKRLNTDAIDNSAGVNMSDYEVNIKIMLQQLLNAGKIKSQEERNKILEEATDEVSELVLANNRGQHRLLSMDKFRSQKGFKIFKNLIFNLKEKGLNTKSEVIPVGKELESLEHSGMAMPRPVLAVLQAYVKMEVYEKFLKSKLLNDEFFDEMFINYFPKSLIDKFGDDLHLHPLKKEIIATVLTNQMVNRSGSCFFFRTEQQSGKNFEQITLSYLIVSKALKVDELRDKILSSDNVKEELKYEALIRVEEVIQLIVQQMLKLSKIPSFKMIEEYSSLVLEVEKVFSLEGEELALSIAYWKGKGLDMETSKMIAIVGLLKTAPDVIYLHEEENLSVPVAVKLSRMINDIFHFDWLSLKLNIVETTTDWELSLQDILKQNLELYKSNLLRFLVESHEEEKLNFLSEDEILESVSKPFDIPLTAFFNTVETLKIDPLINLTTLSVSINRLNFLADTKSAKS